MADEKTPATTDEGIVVAGVIADEQGVIAEGAIGVQGDNAIVVAAFADEDAAKAAYYGLIDREIAGVLDIEGVLVARADETGKIHIVKMTDHKTRNGFLAGAVAGAVVGIIFPPSIIAGALWAGARWSGARQARQRGDAERGREGPCLRPHAGQLRDRRPREAHPGLRGREGAAEGDGREVRTGQRRDRRRRQGGRQGRRHDDGRLTPGASRDAAAAAPTTPGPSPRPARYKVRHDRASGARRTRPAAARWLRAEDDPAGRATPSNVVAGRHALPRHSSSSNSRRRLNDRRAGSTMMVERARWGAPEGGCRWTATSCSGHGTGIRKPSRT